MPLCLASANTRYGDLNYAHAGGEIGPVFDLWPGMSLTTALGAAAGYFDDRFYYGEGSGSATFEGQTPEGIFHSLRFRAAYRSYDRLLPERRKAGTTISAGGSRSRKCSATAT